MNSRVFTASWVAVVLLSACAATPERNEQLEQARAEVQTLSQDPLAAQAASRELDTARGELQQAEAAAEKHRPAEEVTHMAYLATRHAQTGQARVTEARAREQVAQGEAERNRVLLEARTRKADQATAEAQQATAQARAAQAEAAAQAQNAAAAQAQAESVRQSAENLQQQLAELQAKETQRGMVMTLGDVLFDTGAATLKPGATLTLDRLADFLKQNPQVRVIVEGHTDSVGAETYNQELAQRRARSVADELARREIAADRVEAIGRGEAYPVATNSTVAGRQQNRRVEIVFSDEAGRFAQGAREGVLR